MAKDKRMGIGILVAAAIALWFAFGRKPAEAAELSQIEAQLQTATGEEEAALLARKAELEATLAERAIAIEQAKAGIPPSVSVPMLFEARVEQLYQEKIAGIRTSRSGVSSELGQLFYLDDLASAKLAAVKEAERELSGDIHIIYDSQAVAKAAAENQLIDYQRMYQEGLDALASQGLLQKYYEGAGSGGWFDKLRNLETVIPEQEARVASPLTVREEQALEAEAQAQAEAERRAILEAEVAALEAEIAAQLGIPIEEAATMTSEELLAAGAATKATEAQAAYIEQGAVVATVEATQAAAAEAVAVYTAVEASPTASAAEKEVARLSSVSKTTTAQIVQRAASAGITVYTKSPTGAR